MIISHLRVTRGTAAQAARGHLAWLEFRLDGKFEIDGVALRKTTDRRYVLKFPFRRDGARIERAFFKPVDGEVRAEIEATVFARLREQGDLP